MKTPGSVSASLLYTGYLHYAEYTQAGTYSVFCIGGGGGARFGCASCRYNQHLSTMVYYDEKVPFKVLIVLQFFYPPDIAEND